MIIVVIIIIIAVAIIMPLVMTTEKNTNGLNVEIFPTSEGGQIHPNLM